MFGAVNDNHRKGTSVRLYRKIRLLAQTKEDAS